MSFCRQLSSKLEHVIVVSLQEENSHFINLTQNKDSYIPSTNIYRVFVPSVVLGPKYTAGKTDLVLVILECKVPRRRQVRNKQYLSEVICSAIKELNQDNVM